MALLSQRCVPAAIALILLALCLVADARELGPPSRSQIAPPSKFPATGSSYASTSTSTSSSSSPSWPFGPAKRVDVALYGESKCPFCAKWITENAAKLVSQLGAVAEFRLVEWGNARRNATTGDVACQHGESECYANALFACTRDAFGNGGGERSSYRWLRVVECAEKDVFERAADPSDGFDACVVDEVKRGGEPSSAGGPGEGSSGDGGDEIGKDVAKKIRACASGERGLELVAAAERETASLEPPHTFVPWIVVDGWIPVGDASLETVRAVACAAWRGKKEERPPACSRAPGLGTSASSSVS